MLKALWSSFTRPKLGPETAETRERADVSDSSSSSLPQRCEGVADNPNPCTGTSLAHLHVHVVQIDTYPVSQAQRSSIGESTESSASVSLQQDPEWVDIDLGASDMHTNVKEQCDDKKEQIQNGLQRVLSSGRIETKIPSFRVIPHPTQNTSMQIYQAMQLPRFENVEQKDGQWVDQARSNLSKSTTPRTASTESFTEYCRICQQITQEPLMELGCQCKGELAKTHKSCIEQWFNSKGSNKCEICQCVATNFAPPVSPPMQKFWLWRTNGPNLAGRVHHEIRVNPLWIGLIIFCGLLVDVLVSASLGPSAIPVNIVLGILAVGAFYRLLVECWYEHRERM